MKLSTTIFLVTAFATISGPAYAQPPWVEQAQRQREADKQHREHIRESEKRQREFHRETWKRQTEIQREAEKRHDEIQVEYGHRKLDHHREWHEHQAERQREYSQWQAELLREGCTGQVAPHYPYAFFDQPRPMPHLPSQPFFDPYNGVSPLWPPIQQHSVPNSVVVPERYESLGPAPQIAPQPLLQLELTPPNAGTSKELTLRSEGVSL